MHMILKIISYFSWHWDRLTIRSKFSKIIIFVVAVISRLHFFSSKSSWENEIWKFLTKEFFGNGIWPTTLVHNSHSLGRPNDRTNKSWFGGKKYRNISKWIFVNEILECLLLWYTSIVSCLWWWLYLRLSISLVMIVIFVFLFILSLFRPNE
jgi:hypothetical protein